MPADAAQGFDQETAQFHRQRFQGSRIQLAQVFGAMNLAEQGVA